MENIIEIKNLSKRYFITHENASAYRYTALRDVLSAGAKNLWNKAARSKAAKMPTREEIWALKDISLNIKPGEKIGIIGRNGAGKSTLLKILTRITDPTAGYAKLRGRVSSLLEVGTGFHPELTGRENIFLNGAVLGMQKKEIVSKFDEIVDFSGVEKFLDTPVKRFSSGMQVRLAFAVAAHLEPEILLVDEVLAVGDAEFQKKCLGKMDEVSREGGRTIIFVSHNMAAIRQLCDKAILMLSGKIDAVGDTEEVINQYLKSAKGASSTKWSYDCDSSKRIQFLEVELIPSKSSKKKEEIVLRCKYKVRNDAQNIILSVNVRNPMQEIVYYSNDLFLRDSRKRERGVHEILLFIPSYLLVPGTYYVDYAFFDLGEVEHFPDKTLVFNVLERASPIPGTNVSWPSIIYLPDKWFYVQKDQLNRARNKQ